MASNLRVCWCVCISLLLPAALPAGPAVAVTPREDVAWLEKLPDASLKAIYLHCARVSSQRLLSWDEALHCSVAADTLKRRSFGGDFDALLAWWRQHRDRP
jgi:hypothetical protein